MTFQYRHRKQIIIGIILFILVTALGIFLYYKIPKEKNKTKKEEEIVIKKKTTTQEDTTELLKIDIKGQINVPGIYSMEKNARVVDVIEKAGGLTENADTSVINLSKKVVDEMVIIIYSREEVSEFSKTKELEQQVQNNCIQKDENSVRNDACWTNSTTQSTKININTATKEELMSLPGIGESKAKDIISYREENGPFQDIKDITKVSGIGDARFATIQEDITV